MRKDLKDTLKERLCDWMGPMRWAPLAQIEAVVDLVEEVVDNDSNRRWETELGEKKS